MFVRAIYSLIMLLLTPYLLLRLYWKGRRLPLYRQRILERFCLNKQKHGVVDIWIHAVSLGEVIAALPLIEALLSQRRKLLVTTMTPTGSSHLRSKFGDNLPNQYIPYDLAFALRRFYKRYRPRLGIIMETELWPNLIAEAHSAKVPLLLANARLSERSLRNYKPWAFFFKPLLNCFTAILSQSEEDGERFIALGANKDIVKVLGNVKFDLKINAINTEISLQLKTAWGSARPVFIAASTHEGEEAKILDQLNRLQRDIPGLILLIAPRHPERFQTVYQAVQTAGFVTGLRSQPASITRETEVVVLDSLGELLSFYSVSDYAFVGGSLVPVGGHNVLEPIAVQVPVLTGPYLHNFKSICKELSQKEAIEILNTAEDLALALIRLHQNKDFRDKMKHNASLVFENNKGSVQRHLLAIEGCLSKT